MHSDNSLSKTISTLKPTLTLKDCPDPNPTNPNRKEFIKNFGPSDGLEPETKLAPTLAIRYTLPRSLANANLLHS